MSDFIVARDNFYIAYYFYGGPPGLTFTGDTKYNGWSVSATTLPKVRMGGIFAVRQIALAFSPGIFRCPYTSTTYDFQSGGVTFNAVPIALKVKSQTYTPIIKGDWAVCRGSWRLKVSPYTVVACACIVGPNTPGQSKAKAG